MFENQIGTRYGFLKKSVNILNILPFDQRYYCLLKRCKLKKHWFSQSVNTKEKTLKCKCMSRNWFASISKRGQWMGSSVFYEASKASSNDGITVISSFEYWIALKKNLPFLNTDTKNLAPISISNIQTSGSTSKIEYSISPFFHIFLHQTLGTVWLTFSQTEIPIFPPDIVF